MLTSLLVKVKTMADKEIAPAEEKKFKSIPHLNETVLETSNVPSETEQILAKQDGRFEINPQELADVVNFDHRNSSSLLMLLESHKGPAGIAAKLGSDIEKGLQCTLYTAEDYQRAQQQQKSSSGGGGPSRQRSKVGTMVVSDLESRIAQFGENVSHPPKPTPIWRMIWDTVKEDTIIKILIVGAIVTLSIGTALHPETGWSDGLAIIVAIMIVLTVTAVNDWSKEKKFRKLLLMQSDKKVKVVRNGGKIDEISSWDVLVGDVIDLIPGDEVPADGLFISGNHLVIDESPLTGESLPCRKNEKNPFLFSGCQISEGSGRYLVTAVGPRSTGGQIQKLLSEKQDEQTPLQIKLGAVAVQIGKVGIAAGILTFFGLLIRWGIDKASKSWDNSYLLNIVNFFITGVTIVVVAVPEGLPLAVTISLAFSMFKMIQDRCFVRNLAASETMGQATCICTDKTGTLTQNKMTVVKFYNNAGVFNGEGSAAKDAKPYADSTFSVQFRNLLAESIALNSNCFIKTDEKGVVMFVGSATEGALLVFAAKLGATYDKLRSEAKKVEDGEMLFTSEKKRMGTAIYPLVESGGNLKYRFHVKGASEIVLDRCTRIHVDDKNIAVALSQDKVEEIKHIINEWASDGLRTIVVAYKDSDDAPITRDSEDGSQKTNIDTDLVFLGLAGIKDPIRKEVPEAVEKCQSAGLTVRMVTGDNILTAKKIATECGILSQGGLCLEGPEFRALPESEKRRVIPDLKVLARSSPQDKHTLVSLLKQMGEVVAVTGDGTNDAPALKEADVGFAMGISGTQIAMNASDIMLLDDNFATIVQSIRWGRNVFEVIQKFLQFQLAVNLAAILITFFGSVASELYEAPLSAVQLLWVNLIMDSFGALALASDNPPDEILDRPPHKKTENVITKNMLEQIIAVTFYQFTVSLTILLGGYSLFGIDRTDKIGIHAVVFTIFVLMQVFNLLISRQLHHELNFFRGLASNNLFLLMIVIIVVVQVLAVQFAGEFIETRPMSGKEWAYCLIFAFCLIPYMLLFRLFIQLYDATKTKRRGSAANQGSPVLSVKSVSSSGSTSKRDKSALA